MHFWPICLMEKQFYYKQNEKKRDIAACFFSLCNNNYHNMEAVLFFYANLLRMILQVLQWLLYSYLDTIVFPSTIVVKCILHNLPLPSNTMIYFIIVQQTLSLMGPLYHANYLDFIHLFHILILYAYLY